MVIGVKKFGTFPQNLNLAKIPNSRSMILRLFYDTVQRVRVHRPLSSFHGTRSGSKFVPRKKPNYTPQEQLLSHFRNILLEEMDVQKSR